MRSTAVRTPDQDACLAEAGTPESGAPPAAGAAQRPLSVLLVVPSLDGGAAAAGVVDLVRILHAAGHKATVVARGGGRAEEVRRCGGAFLDLDVESANPLAIIANAWRLARLARRERCDIVHAHGRSAAWSGLIAARLARVPFMTTWYKGFREQNGFKRFYNGVMARGDRVVAVGERIAELIRARYGQRPVSVVGVGVDPDRFDPAGVTPARIEAVRRGLGLGETTKLVLVPARMLRRKGHHVVVRAAKRLKDRGVRDFACVFASTDAGTRYAGELWDEVLASGIADVVQMVGPIEDMPAAYAAATVVVCPGLQPEGLPRSVLEAQAMACPVVAADLAVGPEAMLAPPLAPEDRATGWRFAAGDDVALAAALIRVFSMPEPARRATGARGRAFVATRFSPEAAAAEALRIYREVAAP